MDLRELVNREQELHFESDSDKFQYLDSMLDMYKEHEKQIVEAKGADYELRITRPDSKLLYFGGFHGVSDRKIFDVFVQDLVSLRVLLGISKSNLQEADAFNDRLLEYIIHLYNLGYIRPPEVDVSNPTPEKVKESYEQLKLNGLTWPAEYISKLESSFFSLWTPKIERLTGEYDSSHIKEKVLLTVKDASK